MARHSSRSGFSLFSFIWRWLGVLALILATFNPTGNSAFHWIKAAISEGQFGPTHALAIIVLLIGWVIVWIATWRALDTLGVVLASVTLAVLVWLLVDIGWLRTDSRQAIGWIVLVCLSLLFALGMSWSHIWRRLTGQLTVDEVDE